MKKLLLLFALLGPLAAFSQVDLSQAGENYVHEFTHPTYPYGYVQGIRLDSINVKYAEIRFSNLNRTGSVTFIFNHKQEFFEISTRGKDARVLKFFNFAAALNFLDFNGWEYVTGVSSTPEIILLKKKGDFVKN